LGYYPWVDYGFWMNASYFLSDFCLANWLFLHLLGLIMIFIYRKTATIIKKLIIFQFVILIGSPFFYAVLPVMLEWNWVPCG